MEKNTITKILAILVYVPLLFISCEKESTDDGDVMWNLTRID